MTSVAPRTFICISSASIYTKVICLWISTLIVAQRCLSWPNFGHRCLNQSLDTKVQGDTLSEDCKCADLNLRLNLRITVDISGTTLDTVTGEAASRRKTTTGKLYGDRLKSVLATKYHLNRLIKYLQYIPPNKLKVYLCADRASDGTFSGEFVTMKLANWSVVYKTLK
ncbi:hypothetical protein BCR42DRAFT_398484 [Absidia repens]|uniref:Uncharacterized protein n=1 Tax=Absidia repens TaxID=90262 RepID=A0A1X2HXU3_9FUNG|nr:hypothetical protein BCR42DRAFT_398484 [Absidia repens]